MMLSKNSTAKLIMWGSGPYAFVSGILLSLALNIITGLSLYTISLWPPNGLLLLAGSILFACASFGLALLSWRIQPLKSLADVRLQERRRLVRKDEQVRSDEEYIWDHIIDEGGRGVERQRALYLPLLISLISFVMGLVVFIYTLPFHSSSLS